MWQTRAVKGALSGSSVTEGLRFDSSGSDKQDQCHPISLRLFVNSAQFIKR
jgi:hypothetical protein